MYNDSLSDEIVTVLSCAFKLHQRRYQVVKPKATS